MKVGVGACASSTNVGVTVVDGLEFATAVGGVDVVAYVGSAGVDGLWSLMFGRLMVERVHVGVWVRLTGMGENDVVGRGFVAVVEEDGEDRMGTVRVGTALIPGAGFRVCVGFSGSGAVVAGRRLSLIHI